MEAPRFPTVPRWIVKLAGALILLASLAFLVRAIAAADLGALVTALDGRAAIMLGLFAIAYGLALVLLAVAWWLLLDNREGRTGFANALIVYGL